MLPVCFVARWLRSVRGAFAALQEDAFAVAKACEKGNSARFGSDSATFFANHYKPCYNITTFQTPFPTCKDGLMQIEITK